ncbi:hypothetical protein NDU88_001251 [Pleurodeles waltl]|uniref:Uncharacterized protein n=1 Tax=Pleurodeles waltl TaxID=8319 RepID=A0AAV7T001_PLEWA|nr:hypothetical protein NDU88_001251 [Pleurodeles waltl]
MPPGPNRQPEKGRWESPAEEEQPQEATTLSNTSGADHRPSKRTPAPTPTKTPGQVVAVPEEGLERSDPGSGDPRETGKYPAPTAGVPRRWYSHATALAAQRDHSGRGRTPRSGAVARESQDEGGAYYRGGGRRRCSATCQQSRELQRSASSPSFVSIGEAD